jgi:hypothetical protein
MLSLITRRFISIAASICLGLTLLAISVKSSSVSATQEVLVLQEKGSPDHYVPAYHEAPPDAELPPVLDSKQFKQEVVQNAYRLAAELARTLYQQPCYCHCDRDAKHGSLHDCYATKHTAGCAVCLKELFYVYEQTKGRRPRKFVKELSAVSGRRSTSRNIRSQHPDPERIVRDTSLWKRC